MRGVPFRILIAAGNDDFRTSLREVAGTACGLMPIAVSVGEAASIREAREHIASTPPDALLIDWSIVAEDTLAAVRGLLADYPELRVMVLLPDARREYREAAWTVGACACVPRDRIDAEWLQAILCVMNRAKEREARIRAKVA
jgi:DNA-binding NarL/FixJ family response regulator